MSIDRKLMMGNTDMLLLKLLAQEDMYGYQIIEELRKRSNHVFDMKAGTLYPLLHQLGLRRAFSPLMRRMSARRGSASTIT